MSDKPDSLNEPARGNVIVSEHDGRIVSIGPLVLSSTQSSDAWILDPADQLAARLAYTGDPLPVYIEETNTNYAALPAVPSGLTLRPETGFNTSAGGPARANAQIRLEIGDLSSRISRANPRKPQVLTPNSRD